MNLWQSLAGMVRAKLVSPDPEMALETVCREGITLHKICMTEPLTLEFSLMRRDWNRLHGLAAARGYSLTAVKRRGLYWWAKAALGRPVLLAGITVLVALVMWLPTRVLFFQVEGNEQIPARQILEAADSCGLRFGVSRKAVRSEKLKNALMQQLPQLTWAGINTRGCTAVISVREGEMTQEAAPSGEITGIVAARDGFITECTVTSGNALCRPGQTVVEGQLLISPYTDCGLCIRVAPARGEIFAQTQHALQAVTPAEGLKRVSQTESFPRISLLLGKKRINFWKDSGISPATCGRMYSEYYITLPGGFVLPVGIALDTRTECTLQRFDRDPEAAGRSLEAFVRDYTRDRMIAGRILREDLQFSRLPGVLSMDAEFLCQEMIGRENKLKIGDTHEQIS